MRSRWKILIGIGALIFVLYVGSYCWLSRRGYAEADQFRFRGFYYFFPEDSNDWRRKNDACVTLFWPINSLDQAIGLGRNPASEPLFRLSDNAGS